jgi:hypothetical protein
MVRKPGDGILSFGPPHGGFFAEEGWLLKNMLALIESHQPKPPSTMNWGLSCIFTPWGIAMVYFLLPFSVCQENPPT